MLMAIKWTTNEDVDRPAYLELIIKCFALMWSFSISISFQIILIVFYLSNSQVFIIFYIPRAVGKGEVTDSMQLGICWEMNEFEAFRSKILLKEGD